MENAMSEHSPDFHIKSHTYVCCGLGGVYWGLCLVYKESDEYLFVSRESFKE